MISGLMKKKFKMIDCESLNGVGGFIRGVWGAIAQETIGTLVQDFHHPYEMAIAADRGNKSG
jgi:hypothetical protein